MHSVSSAAFSMREARPGLVLAASTTSAAAATFVLALAVGYLQLQVHATSLGLYAGATPFCLTIAALIALNPTWRSLAKKR